LRTRRPASGSFPARDDALLIADHQRAFERREMIMAKGQQAPKTTNKPKLSVKEKKQKKKDKAAAKSGLR
jgi:hypothetical protein